MARLNAAAPIRFGAQAAGAVLVPTGIGRCRLGPARSCVDAWMYAAVAAYNGREAETRTAAVARSNSPTGAVRLERPIGSSISLGFLEVSLGSYTAAIDVLSPLIARFRRGRGSGFH
jgi:hypothetical protein